jgi:phospholipid/cholesterol/gamma-HCH transport system ATP-binding protein
MIELKNIHKSFGDKIILENISIKFDRGKTNIIIGPSFSKNKKLYIFIFFQH